MTELKPFSSFFLDANLISLITFYLSSEIFFKFNESFSRFYYNILNYFE